MTTVAWDGRTMASDGMMRVNGEIAALDYQKIVRRDGLLIGIAGDALAASTYANWVAEPIGPRPISDNVFYVLVVRDGAAELHNNTGRVVEVHAPAAIGSERRGRDRGHDDRPRR